MQDKLVDIIKRLVPELMSRVDEEVAAIPGNDVDRLLVLQYLISNFLCSEYENPATRHRMTEQLFMQLLEQSRQFEQDKY